MKCTRCGMIYNANRDYDKDRIVQCVLGEKHVWEAELPPSRKAPELLTVPKGHQEGHKPCLDLTCNDMACVLARPALTVPKDFMRSGPQQEGRKFDAGKPDWELIPWEAMEAVQRVLAYGERTYGRENWRKVERFRYIKAMWRHWFSYRKDPKATDKDTGESHLAHMICCALFLLELDK